MSGIVEDYGCGLAAIGSALVVLVIVLVLVSLR
jgi:hypothetical protein